MFVPRIQTISTQQKKLLLLQVVSPTQMMQCNSVVLLLTLGLLGCSCVLACTSPQRISAVDVPVRSLTSGVASGGFGYFATYTSPGNVVKVNLETMTHVATATGADGEKYFGAGTVIGDFGYFAEGSTPARVVKFNINTMERVGIVSAADGEKSFSTLPTSAR